MNAVTHLEKVIVGEVSAVTHLEKVIAGETSAVTYTEKVITGEAPPITHLQKVIAGEASPVTHLEYIWAGGSPTPTEHEYTGAVPYTFTADGTPLISWRISGNTIQSGTPTPQNPVDVNGTGELEVNLAIISGDSQTVKNAYYKNVRMSDVLEAGTYTVSYVIDEKTGNVSSSTIGFGTPNIYQKDLKTFTVGYTPITITMTITLETEGCLWVRFLRAGSQTDFSYSASHVRVEKGSTPYGYKIPILMGSTTNNVYLGEVQTERKINKHIFTGSVDENWGYSTSGSNARVYLALDSMAESPSVCTHYQFGTIRTYPYVNEYCINNASAIVIGVDISSITSAADFKTYLQQQYANGTPVTVWYVLATPQTAIVNEPLMRIGDYADEVSNVATIPTVNGLNTFDVDTTVKPSEVYIKYKGR